MLHFDVIGVLAYDADGNFDEKKAKVLFELSALFVEAFFTFNYSIFFHFRVWFVYFGQINSIKLLYLPLFSLAMEYTKVFDTFVHLLITLPASIEY